jgi:hypothetical protein
MQYSAVLRCHHVTGGRDCPGLLDGAKHEGTSALSRKEDGEAAHVLAAAALGQHLQLQLLAGRDLHVDDGGRVVPRVLAGGEGPLCHGLAQVALGVPLGHASVNGVYQGAPHDVDVLPHVCEDNGGAGVLAEGKVLTSGEVRIVEDLDQHLLGQRRLFAALGPA